MASMKIKKGDMVKVIAGKDKDKEGKVISVKRTDSISFSFTISFLMFTNSFH